MIHLSFAARALHVLRSRLRARALPTIALSRQERLGLIFSAIERCGTDCPAYAIWALELYTYQAASVPEMSERRLSC
ncbi:hypothetical protein [Mesorhizobium sp. RIZ17]|uniref:hypothetical protein n=1 Tax=Mesorhizobium sp. RIZ17 TaxID=3132743 RepID=UPI003DA9C89E